MTGNTLIADKLSDTASNIRCSLSLLERLVGEDRSDEGQGIQLSYEDVLALGMLIRSMRDAQIHVIEGLERFEKADKLAGVAA